VLLYTIYIYYARYTVFQVLPGNYLEVALPLLFLQAILSMNFLTSLTVASFIEFHISIQKTTINVNMTYRFIQIYTYIMSM
jgi:hypothetical protein